jgi:hypothetical protein
MPDATALSLVQKFDPQVSVFGRLEDHTGDVDDWLVCLCGVLQLTKFWGGEETAEGLRMLECLERHEPSIAVEYNEFVLVVVIGDDQEPLGRVEPMGDDVVGQGDDATMLIVDHLGEGIALSGRFARQSRVLGVDPKAHDLDVREVGVRRHA